jgi:hypothetical protein
MAEEFGTEFDELLGAPNTLESMSIGGAEDELSPVVKAQIDEEDKKKNFDKFDMPIPGQSLTGEPGGAAYEQAPQYTDVEDVADYLFDRMLNPHVQRDVLRMLDAEVPATNLAEVVLLHGAQEGKWNMDMVMMAMEPVTAILYGLGDRAGINVVTHAKNTTKPIDTSGFRKQAKEAAKGKRAELMPEPKPIENLKKGLMSRPTGGEK